MDTTKDELRGRLAELTGWPVEMLEDYRELSDLAGASGREVFLEEYGEFEAVSGLNPGAAINKYLATVGSLISYAQIQLNNSYARKNKQ